MKIEYRFKRTPQHTWRVTRIINGAGEVLPGEYPSKKAARAAFSVPKGGR